MTMKRALAGLASLINCSELHGECHKPMIFPFPFLMGARTPSPLVWLDWPPTARRLMLNRFLLQYMGRKNSKLFWTFSCWKRDVVVHRRGLCFDTNQVIWVIVISRLILQKAVPKNTRKLHKIQLHKYKFTF